MKSLLLLSILFLSSQLNAQSVVHHILPKVSKRPAFQSLTESTQKDLVKKYAAIYLENNLIRAPFINYNQLRFQKHLRSQPTIFKDLGFNQPPSFENTVDFLNSSRDFKNIIQRTEFGTCMGVTSVMRKVNMLAHFDPENKYNSYVPFNESLKTQFYKGLIDKMMANKPVLIPYFKNTREFTADPRFNEYFKRHALDQWALNNVTFHGGVMQMMRGASSKMSPRYKRKLYRKLKRRLALGYNPKLFFALKGDIREYERLRIHVVQVFKVEEPDEDGNYKVHYWDPNYKYYQMDEDEDVQIPYWLEAQLKSGDESLELSNNVKKAYFFNVAQIINVNQKEKTTAGGYDDISYLGIYRWDDAEINEILNNYEDFCHQYPNLCRAK